MFVDEQRRTPSDEARRLIRQIAKEGGDPVAPLREAYLERKSGGFVAAKCNIVWALKDIGTESAKAALLDIAVDPGRDGMWPGEWAARSYLSMVTKPHEIAKLLDSTSDGVKGNALFALAGKALPPDIVPRVGALLGTGSWTLRCQAASVLARDPSGTCVKEKVDAILASLKALNSIPDADKPTSSTGFTPREMVLGSCAWSLGQIKAAEELLGVGLAKAKGLERKVIVLALASHGQAGVRPDLIRMLHDEKNGYLRTLAVRGLAGIGLPEDLPLLQRLAKSDPYSRPSVRDRLLPVETKLPEREHPARRAAEQAITAIRKRAMDKR